jgi:hypothetical protein
MSRFVICGSRVRKSLWRVRAESEDRSPVLARRRGKVMSRLGWTIEALLLMEPGCKICESPHCDDPSVPHAGNCPDEECDDGVPHMMMALAAGSDVRSVVEAGSRYPGRLLLLPERRAVAVVDCEGWIVALRHFPDIYHWASAMRVG